MFNIRRMPHQLFDVMEGMNVDKHETIYLFVENYVRRAN